MTGAHDVTPAVRLRSVEDRDLDVFFEHQADPQAVEMAAFPARDKDQFAAHWGRNYGAKTVITGDYFEDALTAAEQHVEETGGTFIHPYEDQLVIAGQGTIGLELVEQVPDVAAVLIPVGGGGLSMGIAIALRALPSGGASGRRAGRRRRRHHRRRHRREDPE